MKEEIKLFSEMKASNRLSYISDKATRFGWKSLAYLAENFERFGTKGYKYHPKSWQICKHFTRSCKTDFV